MIWSVVGMAEDGSDKKKKKKKSKTQGNCCQQLNLYRYGNISILQILI
jgi:hypothetical protein